MWPKMKCCHDTIIILFFIFDVFVKILIWLTAELIKIKETWGRALCLVNYKSGIKNSRWETYFNITCQNESICIELWSNCIHLISFLKVRLTFTHTYPRKIVITHIYLYDSEVFALICVQSQGNVTFESYIFKFCTYISLKFCCFCLTTLNFWSL